MAEMQALFPVYLARSRTEDVDTEDYDVMVAQNEALINQNFDNLFNHTQALQDTVAAQAATISALERALRELKEGK